MKKMVLFLFLLSGCALGGAVEKEQESHAAYQKCLVANQANPAKCAALYAIWMNDKADLDHRRQTLGGK